MTGDLAQRLLRGDRRALALALRVVEDGEPSRRELLAAVAPRLGRALRVGVTGAPGVGKSSLVSALIRVARRLGRSVAVLAVDPSSPFSGGALLGDRIRMSEHVLDSEVFLRSMASRGALGGLARASGEAMDLLDAAGFDLIFLETAGAGQTDLAVLHEADVVSVVLAPGGGDHVQAMKSGILEIASLWVVNKSDDPRAPRVRDELLAALALGERTVGEDSVVLTNAHDGSGVESLLEALESRRPDAETLVRSRRLRAATRLAGALEDRVELWIRRPSTALDRCLDRITAGELTPEDAAADLLTGGIPTSEPTP